MKIETPVDNVGFKVINLVPWPEVRNSADVTIIQTKRDGHGNPINDVIIRYGRYPVSVADARTWANAILAACDIADGLVAAPAQPVPVATEAQSASLREALADYAHSAWSGWMQYLFHKSTYNHDDTVTIPSGLVTRWERQMATSYEDLPDDEKQSDRAEADKMIAIVRDHLKLV